jgi:hypothetical protein
MAHWVNFMELPVNGMRFNTDATYARSIKAKDVIVLTREPDNDHDRFAVCVTHNGSKIGYVPASSARAVACLMDGGFPLRARITMCDSRTLNATMLIAINDRATDQSAG